MRHLLIVLLVLSVAVSAGARSIAGGWCLKGDIWGEPPHGVCGSIDIRVTPVEVSTWGAIKAMYD
ncbi:MAG: hypothetical protein ABIE42_08610 [Candidatus Eisenbacteria bacterium]